MKRILIQIYEVQQPEEAEALVALGVDHIGTVILSRETWKSPVLRETVRTAQAAGGKSSLIPLFDDPAVILCLLDYYQPDFVHFCETLSPFPSDRGIVSRQCSRLLALQRTVKGKFPMVSVMRSLSVPQPAEVYPPEIATRILAMAETLAPFSDYFLLDTLAGGNNHPALQSQPVPGFVGITGEVCDWDLAAAIAAQSPIPVILAGGLGADNAREAILKVKPAGVDSCTKTNAVDKAGRPVRFKKDLYKVARMVEAVRSTEREC